MIKNTAFSLTGKATNSICEDFMKKTLIFYKPEYADLAIKLRDNYRAHDHDDGYAIMKM